MYYVVIPKTENNYLDCSTCIRLCARLTEIMCSQVFTQKEDICLHKKTTVYKKRRLQADPFAFFCIFNIAILSVDLINFSDRKNRISDSDVFIFDIIIYYVRNWPYETDS